jgi:hypothetical protein
MSKEIVKFEFEKETKNSIRYKEVPEDGKAPIVGSLYVQKWFAGNSKSLNITIELNP